ncbi:hypothetical protein [Allofranklinella schreckenbergeri]|uniref:hypothetical protein n=1 Tax=Allofranklinella schreckenbergeri TaxID=1076744 RepID=UPI0011C3AD78|nr:hypothetical protein [Allofranklinella schreckenbergeri]
MRETAPDPECAGLCKGAASLPAAAHHHATITWMGCTARPLHPHLLHIKKKQNVLVLATLAMLAISF